MYFYTMTSSSFIVLLVYGFLFAWLTIPRVAEHAYGKKKQNKKDISYNTLRRFFGLDKKMKPRSKKVNF